LGSPVAGAHRGLAPQMYDMPVVLKKTNIKNDVCLHSETLLLQGFYFVSLFIHCPYLRKKILGTDSNIELGHLISSLFVILIYRIY
ncbi:TPA: hypothetical protein ACG17M_001514, partial [Streptococcus agalactiae]